MCTRRIFFLENNQQFFKQVLWIISFLLILFQDGSSLYAQKQGQGLLDSLIEKLPLQKDDTNKVLLLSRISHAYFSIDPETGIRYGKAALLLAEKLNWNQGMAEANNAMAANYYTKSDFQLALSYFRNAEDHYSKDGNKPGLAKVMANMGIIFQSLGNYPSALEYFLKALEMNESLGEEDRAASNLQNIGIVYYAQGDYDKALDYYKRSAAIYEKKNNQSGMAGNYTNIGNAYSAKKEIEKAIDYTGRAMKIYEQLGDKSRIATTLGNMGNRYFERGDVLNAIRYNFEALNMNRELGNRSGYALNLSNISDLYKFLYMDTTGIRIPDSLGTKKEVLIKSVHYLREVISICHETGDLPMLASASKDLSEVLSQSGDYKGALETFQEGVKIRDSIFSKDNKLKISDLEKQREEDIKQKEIEIQRLQLLKAQSERWYYVSGVIGLAMLLLVLLNRFRVKKRAGEKLEKAYHELKSTQQQLVEQEKLASLGALTAGIAHEIKNPLNFVNNFSELSMEMMDELMEEKNPDEKNEIANGVKDNLRKIMGHGKRADSIVQSMLLHSRHGDTQLHPVDINKICSEIADLAFHGMKANIPDFNVAIVKSFSPDLPPVKAILQDISRVFVNLLNNAFYAVNEKSKSMKGKDDPSLFKPSVTISTFQRGKEVIISIKDNGPGIPDAIRKKIFEPFFTTKPAGQGTGLGLSICYDIIKTHGGNMSLESKPGEFTEFIISLPL